MAIGPDDSSRPEAVDRYLGQKVRARREELDMTPEELAFLSNIETPALEEIEAGARRITPAEMIALAAALGITIEEFFEGL